MKRFRGYVKTSRAGSRDEFVFEADDDASDKDIEDIAKDCMFDLIEWGYEEEAEKPRSR